MDEALAAALQQLRDVHEPTVPTVFPPPFGWWLVATLVIALAVYFVWRWRRERLRIKPYLAIRRRAREFTKMRSTELWDHRTYANEVNKLYKSLLVNVEGRADAVKSHGLAWQELLEARFSEPRFVRSGGHALGSVRYMPLQTECSEFSELVADTLFNVGPPASR